MQAHGHMRDQATTLGVVVAGQHWLVDMSDVSEVLPVPPLTRVPLSKRWFRGVANIRGNLFCISDIAAFQQKGEAVGDATNRVLLVSEKYAMNVGLLVDRVLGLRDARKWHQVTNNGQIEFQDSQNVSWCKLDIPELLSQNEFLQVSI